MEFVKHSRLDLLPDESLTLGLMDDVDAELLIRYMIEKGFLGFDFQSVPPELQEAFEAYENIHRRVGESPDVIYN